MGNPFGRSYSYITLARILGEQKSLDWRPTGFKSKRFILKLILLGDSRIAVFHSSTGRVVSAGQSLMIEGRRLSVINKEHDYV